MLIASLLFDSVYRRPTSCTRNAVPSPKWVTGTQTRCLSSVSVYLANFLGVTLCVFFVWCRAQFQPNKPKSDCVCVNEPLNVYLNAFRRKTDIKTHSNTNYLQQIYWALINWPHTHISMMACAHFHPSAPRIAYHFWQYLSSYSVRSFSCSLIIVFCPFMSLIIQLISKRLTR